MSYGGYPLLSNDTADPCGLIAKYMFSDSFALADSTLINYIPIDETGIAHSVDINYKFKTPSNGDEI